ncbi:hypothetical protein [Streptomyces sp. NPDC059378]|uniref:hypothetical protein n=1 Tax=Streptomyces sp. NPDC059378 TaxID=3346815 RepID=UPI0036AF237D
MTPDASAAAYRDVLRRAEGPLIVMADNAFAASQVRALIRGDPRYRLLVTFQDRLPTLGARVLAADELTPDAATCWRKRCGSPIRGGAEEESEALRRAAALCGQLPLALQIAAALLAYDLGKPVAELAGELPRSGATAGAR